MLLSAAYRAELESLEGDTASGSGAKRILQAHGDAVEAVEVSSMWVLRDINTPDDYQTLLGDFDASSGED